MATPNIQLIAETAVKKHAAEKNAHGVVGAIIGQNHGHTGGADGQRIQHSDLLGLVGGDYHSQIPSSNMLAYAARHG